MGDDVVDRSWSTLRVDQDGAVLQVTLNRPAAANGLSRELIGELTEVAQLVRRRTDIHVVVLTGGQHIFSEGGEVSTIRTRISAPTLLERRRAVVQGADMVQAWQDIEAVTIAAIEGRCRGGACALALACDFRIMSETAVFFLPEVPLGLNMGWGTIPRVTGFVGPARAKRFIILGQAPSPDICLAWGLIDEVTAQGQALSAAHRWAAEIAALPPVPVRMAKASISASSAVTSRLASHMEVDQFLLTATSDDFTEGIAALNENRPGRFQGN